MCKKWCLLWFAANMMNVLHTSYLQQTSFIRHRICTCLYYAYKKCALIFSLFSDNWSFKCIHPSENPRRLSRCVSNIFIANILKHFSILKINYFKFELVAGVLELLILSINLVNLIFVSYIYLFLSLNKRWFIPITNMLNGIIQY